MDESEIDFQNTGSDSEDDELEVVNAQDEDSEVRLPKGYDVFEKFHNSVVGHLGLIRLRNFLDIIGWE